MSYVVIDPSATDYQVLGISKTEHVPPYIQIKYRDDDDEENEFLVCHRDVGRYYENIIGFYPADCENYYDGDDIHWLVGESVELDNVMRLADIIYKEEQ